ncbi:hypothetical protein L6164_005147 [Bauhinia variegata]|uniref:Uncharacterized protein n=1 Tax=Bauhinia variegata TaxID=167791 RepID=A0ACB9PSA2_BAUVA|nr:hypothetical protein L6164_005147 [Bauhinia variegata]
MVNEGEDGNDKVMLLDGVLETMPVFAKTVVAPLDRVKILFRTRRAEFQTTGLLGSVKRIAKTEGLWGFCRGNGASVARIIPYAALHCNLLIMASDNAELKGTVIAKTQGWKALFSGLSINYIRVRYYC